MGRSKDVSSSANAAEPPDAPRETGGNMPAKETPLEQQSTTRSLLAAESQAAILSRHEKVEASSQAGPTTCAIRSYFNLAQDAELSGSGTRQAKGTAKAKEGASKVAREMASRPWRRGAPVSWSLRWPGLS